MKRFLRDVDDLLRGRFTRDEHLAQGRVDVPTRTLILACLFMGAVYGAFMGLVAVLGPVANFEQLLATTLKVPLLFLLTLVVTFPSLYVVSALFDSRLRYGETLRLLLIAITANLALLASLGPVTGFFTLSTDSYHFMMLLNVLFFGVSGLVGLGFLRRTLEGVFGAGTPDEPDKPAEPSVQTGSKDDDTPEAIVRRHLSRDKPVPPSRRVFTLWTIIFGVVGAQMGWILRPFVGNPGMEFT